MIAQKYFTKELAPFKSELETIAKKNGVNDVDTYIQDRNWKFRSSGISLESISSVSFSSVVPTISARIRGAKKNFTDWLWAVGDFTINDKGEGEIKYKKDVYKFSIARNKAAQDFTIKLFNVSDASLIKEFKRAIYKTTYCINCEVCEVECPTGALSVYPTIKIDRKKCIHCHRCLDFHDNGCIVASSLLISTEKNMKAKTAIDRYNTFGLREEWLDMYFADPETYWENNGLGPKQIPAMKNWLRDAEIIDAKNNITELGTILANIYQDQKQLVWEIIWINLTYNSFVCQWYAARVKNHEKFSKSLLIEMILEEFPGVYKERTVKNAVDALINTMKESPIGNEFYQYEQEGKDIAFRNSFDDVSEEAVAYSIYKYGRDKGISMIRITDLQNQENEHGIFREFCIEKNALEKSLRSINSSDNRIIVAELNMGLDHITLRENMNLADVLKSVIE